MDAGPYMIGIAGVTCSGKTRLAGHLQEIFPERLPLVLHLDSYYRDLSSLDPRERETRNFDSPEAIDHELFVRQVSAIAEGREISGPVYDFVTHTRADHSIHLTPQDLVIVEGLFALYWPEARRQFHTKVFVNLTPETLLARRLERDVRERGRTKEFVLRQYHQTVAPMNEESVLPTSVFADVLVSGEDPLEHSAAAVVNHMSLSSVTKKRAN